MHISFFVFRPSRPGQGDKNDVSDNDGGGGSAPATAGIASPGGGGSSGGGNSAPNSAGVQVSQQRQWGFRRDARGSDRRRRVSNIQRGDPSQPAEVPPGEPSRGQGLRFHVPPRPQGPGRKGQGAENPSKTASTPIGREAIVYSPASSAYSMASSARGSTPGSDMFFASGKGPF